jgi:hypothetical protein
LGRIPDCLPTTIPHARDIQHMTTFVLTFTDPDTAPPTFLGQAIFALDETNGQLSDPIIIGHAWSLGLNPGGQVVTEAIPPEEARHFPKDVQNTLLKHDYLREFLQARNLSERLLEHDRAINTHVTSSPGSQYAGILLERFAEAAPDEDALDEVVPQFVAEFGVAALDQARVVFHNLERYEELYEEHARAIQ